MEHVADLALRLFDGTRQALRLPASDRRLLDACCRLHDLAFVRHPDDHAVRGAWIVMREGLAGFGAGDRAIVAAAISIHSARDPRRPAIPVCLSRADEERALRIVAYLRVADALDHGHIQDTQIRSVRVRDGVCRVSVRARFFPQGVERARQRADTWARVMPLPLCVQASRSGPTASLFQGVVGRGDPALVSAQRLLAAQFRVMRDNLQRIPSGSDPAYLHDLRVALRRARAALRFFRPLLRGTGAARIAREMARLSARLSPYRDNQSWLAFLASADVGAACAGAREWRPYLQEQRRAGRRLWRRLGAVCRSAETVAFVRSLSVYIKSDLPALAAAGAGPAFKEFAARRLRKAAAKAWREREDPYVLDAEGLHATRKRRRRLRYYAEFCAPALGAPIEQLASDLKAIAGALGAVHDMDAHLAQAVAGGVRPPAALRRHMAERRDREFGRFVIRERLLRKNKIRLYLDNVLEGSARRH